MPAKKTIKVTLVRSLISRLAKHQACIRGLGLRKIGQCVVVEDTPSIRGMINKVAYMLKIEDGE